MTIKSLSYRLIIDNICSGALLPVRASSVICPTCYMYVYQQSACQILKIVSQQKPARQEQIILRY